MIKSVDMCVIVLPGTPANTVTQVILFIELCKFLCDKIRSEETSPLRIVLYHCGKAL